MSHSSAGFIGGNHGHDARRHLSGLLVGVDLDMRALDLGELAYLDVLTEQSSGFLDGFLHGGVTGGCCQNLIHGGCFGLDGVIEHAAGEFHELRGLGHEVGLGVQLDRIAGLAVGGFDNGGGDGAFLSLAAFTLASGLDALGADDFLGASHIAFGFGQGLLDVHHAGAGFLAHLLDQSCSDCCH